MVGITACFDVVKKIAQFLLLKQKIMHIIKQIILYGFGKKEIYY